MFIHWHMFVFTGNWCLSQRVDYAKSEKESRSSENLTRVDSKKRLPSSWGHSSSRSVEISPPPMPTNTSNSSFSREETVSQSESSPSTSKKNPKGSGRYVKKDPPWFCRFYSYILKTFPENIENDHPRNQLSSKS